MNEYLPTKTNLMNLQSSIKLSKQGQSLLEHKKLILMNQKQEYEEKAKKIREQINNFFKEAYMQLREASMDMGIDNIRKVVDFFPIEDDIDIKYKTIMGVEIPSIVWNQKVDNKNINYNFYSTTISLDKTVMKFNELKEYLFNLAELENTLRRLEIAIRKVQTRSNALQNIIIPEQGKIAKTIQNALEEKEREDFSRLKVIKKNK